jgi:hypothetical protein
VGAVAAQAFPASLAGLRPSAAITFYGSLALTWSLVGGWLGRESGSNVALHWVQLPVSPLRLHGLRFATLTGVALVLAGLQIVLIAGLIRVGGAGEDALRLLTGLPGTTLVCLVFGVLVWALGGWGVAGDGWAALLVAASLSTLELVARLQPEWLGPLAGPVDAIGLPLDDLGMASGFLAGRGAGGWTALLRVVAWLAVWGIVGALGVKTRSRRRPSSYRR